MKHMEMKKDDFWLLLITLMDRTGACVSHVHACGKSSFRAGGCATRAFWVGEYTLEPISGTPPTDNEYSHIQNQVVADFFGIQIDMRSPHVQVFVYVELVLAIL